MARKSTILQPVSFGQLDGTDSMNCTVRALANCTDMPITQAKELLSKHGRKAHDGCKVDVFEAAYQEAGLEFIGFFGSGPQSMAEEEHSKLHKGCSKRYKGVTLDTFCKAFKRGSYVVVVAGHALCVRGGMIIDKGAQLGNKSVHMVWKKPSIVR